VVTQLVGTTYPELLHETDLVPICIAKNEVFVTYDNKIEVADSWEICIMFQDTSYHGFDKNVSFKIFNGGY